MRVLVVEDDLGIAGGLRNNLEQRGYVVEVCDAVTTAWAALCADKFDLVLLDLGLIDGDGTELLRRLRQSNHQMSALPDPATPVLIITARERIADRIHGLNLGADDYVVKPFDVDELEARIRALLRRSAGRSSPVITHGPLVIDPAARTVLRNGEPAELSPREFSLLLLLIESRGRVLPRRQLEARLYQGQGSLESNALEVHVHHLRRKLGDGIIQTMRGVGYFIAKDPGREADG